jgi:hypothetical protein
MGELTDYFTRHITLVLDNDQRSYGMATGIAREVVAERAPTLGEYRAMAERDRVSEYASDIGERILDQLHELVDDALPEGGSLARLLVMELMPFGTGDLAYAVGEHYVPDPDDMEGVLDEDEDEDEEAGE